VTTSTQADPLVGRMRPFGTTIFSEMSALATRTCSVNLGQGFPDTDGPPEMLAAAAEALRSGANQYPPLPGIPALRAAIVAHEQRFWGLERNPDTEVVVTAGATEAIAASILGLCEPGDEVVCFEPYYDSYAASIALAGAVRRPVTLRPTASDQTRGGDQGSASDQTRASGRYGFDEDELRAAFGPRTRMILLNTPHNPTGKVFTSDELALIAQLCQEHDVYAVTDEVYEHLVFTDASAPHIPLAALPGMRERTLRISSAGKSFSCTGWKVGWATGPAPLVSAATRVKQFLTFVNAGPLQSRRDRLVAGLSDAGFGVLPSEGTYFVTADITPLGGTDGVDFCRALPERCGVVAVPTQVFYDHQEQGRRLIRFAFCKREDVIDEAAKRLRTLA
jgi:N-succinyldiaminopimelate aminotransferase